MSRRARTLLFGLAALVASVAIAWVLVGAHRTEGRGELGLQRRQTLHLETALEQSGAPLAVTLDGEWVTTVTAVRDGERDLACEVVSARLSGAGVARGSPADLDAIGQRLSRRFWVTYRVDGTALRIHFPRDVSPGDRNLLQMIVTETEVVRPAAVRPQWTATERDGAGTYLAIYQASQAGEWRKRKVRYVDVDPDATQALPVEVVDSHWRITVDATGEVVALEGQDRIRVVAPMAPPDHEQAGDQLDLSAAVRLAAPRVARGDELIGSLERAQVDTMPVGAQAADREQALAERDRRLLDGHTAAEILAAAREKRDDRELPARLAALVRRQPESIAALIALVRESGGRALATDALGSAGTPPALAALGALARDAAAPEAARVDALNALVRVKQPGPSEVRIAADLLDDPLPEVRRTARMIDGALASALRARDPAAAAAIERALFERYAGATAPEQSDLLDGLGNSAGPLALEAATKAFDSPNVDVRVAAARSLRRVEDSAADLRLAGALDGDRDERVRLAAIQAATVRWPDRPTAESPPRTAADPLVVALLKAAVADRSESVRAAAVGLLRRHRDAGPEIAEALRRIAAEDPHAGVRRLAAGP